MLPFRKCLWVSIMWLMAAAVPYAQADFIPSWSYSDTVVTTGPYAFQKPLYSGTYSPDGRVAMGFDDVTGQRSGSAIGITSVAPYLMSPIYTGPDEPLGFRGTSYLDTTVNTFDLKVHLTDAASGASGNLIFHGGVVGSVSYGTYLGTRPGVTEDRTFVQFTNLTQSLLLGNDRYTVRMYQYSGGMDVQVTTVPEPSTLALATIGLAGLGLRLWRRRKGTAHG